MKRFYKEVSIRPEGIGFAVLLDGKPVRTPAKKPLILPNAVLAGEIAKEWRGQSEDVKPQNMPLMRLAATALDRVVEMPEAVADEAARYAETDLLCYRASEPDALVRRQAEAWQPVLDWVSLRFDAPLRVTTGLLHVGQSADTLRALRSALPVQDVFALTAIADLAAVLGSLVLALAVWEGRIGAAEAAEFGMIDELYQAERWGEDAEAARRRQAIRAEVDADARFLGALRPLASGAQPDPRINS